MKHELIHIDNTYEYEELPSKLCKVLYITMTYDAHSRKNIQHCERQANIDNIYLVETSQLLWGAFRGNQQFGFGHLGCYLR